MLAHFLLTSLIACQSSIGMISKISLSKNEDLKIRPFQNNPINYLQTRKINYRTLRNKDIIWFDKAVQVATFSFEKALRQANEHFHLAAFSTVVTLFSQQHGIWLTDCNQLIIFNPKKTTCLVVYRHKTNWQKYETRMPKLLLYSSSR